MYSIRVIPNVVNDGTDEEGKPKVKVTYIRKTNPSEKTRALKDEEGNSVFPVQRMMHLQLFEEDTEHTLGGDTKAFTQNIFENSDSLLFDKIEILVNTKEKHKVLATQSKVMNLNEKLPGLVRNRPAPDHYATYIAKDGSTKRLRANRRTSSGDFEKEDVVLGKVSYFLFSNQVNDEDDAIRYAIELHAISNDQVRPTDTVAADTAKAEVEKEETKPID